MDPGDLLYRLNDVGYVNWLKAGQCLNILKNALLPFINTQMLCFHAGILRRNDHLRAPCMNACRGKSNQLCALCSNWQFEIVKHHRQPSVNIHWENCSPPFWRTNHWELAKAYMPRGQAKVTGNEYDASALLNLINHCKHFPDVGLKYVKEMIKCRNEMMHSGNLCLNDKWMSNFQITLTSCMQLFSHIPEMLSAGQQITELLKADLSICIYGVARADSRVDGLEEDSVCMQHNWLDRISQWEEDLLKERLQELLPHSAEDDHIPDAEELMTLGGFLQASSDLSQMFSAELQTISMLQAKRQAEEGSTP